VEGKTNLAREDKWTKLAVMCLTSGVIVKKAAFSDFRQYEVDYSAET